MNKPTRVVLILVLTTLTACGPPISNKPEYPEHVGDIAFDARIDDPGFKVCDEKNIYQYYNFGKGLQYQGEKSAINQYFEKGLAPKDQPGQTGFLTIRFVVNCEGKTGRFRTQGMDTDYNEKEFEKELTDHYLKLTKGLDGWIPGEESHRKFDYYQYLTFKIDDGKLIEIMP